ncbi:MAG: NAD kinase [Mycobacteriaceae bacterium]
MNNSGNKEAMCTDRREVLIVAHTGRSEIGGVVQKIANILSKNNIGLRILSHEFFNTEASVPVPMNQELFQAVGVNPVVVDASDVAAVGCEIVLVLGGDGTFLRAAELARSAEIPVLGINLGRIGFLAEAEAEHLYEVLDQVIHKKYQVESRMTLDVLVRVDSEIVGKGWALNEASIEKRTRFGVLEVVVEVDGRPVSAFGCDGVLVSTPTGSTAYAFSAGGPVVWPELEALLVVPSNAHALFARPMVTSPESLIAIEIDADGHDAVVFCDGRRELVVPAGGRIEIVRGEFPVQWVRLNSAPFADRLVHKFALPVTGWRGRG